MALVPRNIPKNAPVRPGIKPRSRFQPPARPAASTPANPADIKADREYQVWLNQPVAIHGRVIGGQALKLRGDILAAQLQSNSNAVAAWTEL